MCPFENCLPVRERRRGRQRQTIDLVPKWQNPNVDVASGQLSGPIRIQPDAFHSGLRGLVRSNGRPVYEERPFNLQSLLY